MGAKGQIVPVVEAEVVQHAGPDVGRLMEMALGQGEGGVAALERLVSLQERMLVVQAEQAMDRALAKFHAECPPIPKDAEIGHLQVTRNGRKVAVRYTRLETLVPIIRPTLQSCGLSFGWTQQDREGEVEITCSLYHVLGAKRHSSVVMPVPEKAAGQSPMQTKNSSVSYGRRVTLTGVLGLVSTDEDVDGQAGTASEKLTGEEAGHLAVLADEVNLSEAALTKLLALLGVSAFAELDRSLYPTALRMIEAKRAAR